MIKLKPTSECKIVVIPKYVGNYSNFKVDGCQRNSKVEYSLCNSIRSDIERYVDNVAQVYVKQTCLYDVKGKEFKTLYDALLYKYRLKDTEKDIMPNYIFQYKEPDDDCDTLGSTSNFKELIEEAYMNPWEFKVNDAEEILTLEQQKFLQNVIEAGLKVDGIVKLLEV